MKESHPFESCENGVCVADHLSVIEYESVVLFVVSWDVDCFIFSQLSLSLSEKFLLR